MPQTTWLRDQTSRPTWNRTCQRSWVSRAKFAKPSLTSCLTPVDAMPQGGNPDAPDACDRNEIADQQGRDLSHAQVADLATGIGMNEDTRRRCLEPSLRLKASGGTALASQWAMGWCSGTALEIESKALSDAARRCA